MDLIDQTAGPWMNAYFLDGEIENNSMAAKRRKKRKTICFTDSSVKVSSPGSFFVAQQPA